ncbi:MAG: SdpI family protein [Cellulosilyticaceae bacterium]
MKKINPWISSAFVLTIISIVITVLFYSKLPAEVPTHFNVSGTPDAWSSKSFVFFTAILPFLIGGLTLLLPKIDPKRSSFIKHSKAYNIFMFVIMLFMIGLHWSTMLFALGYNVSINKVVMLSIGILFIIIGNYMPQIRPNYTFGIKTPWALYDENNWRSTHRFGGYMFILMGLTAFLYFFISTQFMAIVFFTVVLAGTFVSYLYSYLYFRKHNTPK